MKFNVIYLTNVFAQSTVKVSRKILKVGLIYLPILTPEALVLRPGLQTNSSELSQPYLKNM